MNLRARCGERERGKMSGGACIRWLSFGRLPRRAASMVKSKSKAERAKGKGALLLKRKALKKKAVEAPAGDASGAEATAVPADRRSRKREKFFRSESLRTHSLSLSLSLFSRGGRPHPTTCSRRASR